MASGSELPELQHGAVLLADISGFTPLTEQFVRDFGASRGGEELTRHLNGVYDALIHEVTSSRGAVVGFSGDAMTCWFDGDDGSIAVACGLRLQHAMRASASGLAIKVSITTGRVRRFIVGDPRLHVIDALCGSLLDRVARGETLAERGELVVGSEVVAALGARVTISRWAEPERFAVVTELAGAPAPVPWPPLDTGALAEAKLQCWLLPAVYDRLRQGHGDYLSELRQVVTMFVRFEGLDYDHDDGVGAKLDTFVRWVQSVVERHEGALLQLTTGDKGNYLFAAFGAPIAHEDATARALHAALALREPPASVFVTHTQIGLSRGQLRTGGYGSEQRRTYGALGDETNVAARLMMKAAPGQVLASERVVKHAGPRYQFESLGQVALKGKQQLVPIYELRGVAAVPTQRRVRARTPIIGRGVECALLQDVLERACGGELGHTIIVEGQPGIGKSRLVGDLLDRARRNAVACQVTAGSAIESTVPYYAWRRVFARLFGLDQSHRTDRDAMRAQVAARMPPALAPLMPLLAILMPVEMQNTATTSELQGANRVAQTRKLLVQLLDALAPAGAPFLLVIDDAHFLDSASWALVEAVREHVGRMILVLSLRPPRTPIAALAELARRPTTHVIRLADLPPADVVTLVAQVLGVVEVPDAIAALVRRIAEGNPFFAEQLAVALREARVIEVVDGECRVIRPLDTLPFPDTIEGVVTSRIDRLPPAEQLALKVASVLGRAFQISPLRAVFPVIAERDRVPQYVAALSRQELAMRDESRADTYTFKHAITQEVAYNLMLFEQRRELHEQMADWFDDQRQVDMSALAVRAHHRLAAIDGVDHPDERALRKALDAVMVAGQRSIAVGATAEGVAYLDSARTLIDRLPPSRERSTTELDLCSWRGMALAVAKGPADEAVGRELARARALCEEVGDRSRLFEALFNQWYAHITNSEKSGALEFSQQLLDLAGDADDAMALLARHARGATLIPIGRHAEGVELLKSALAIARRSSREAMGPLAHARNPILASHCYLAWATWFLGFPAQSLDEAEQALAIATQATHPLNLAQAHGFAAIVHRFRRELDAAERHITRAYAIASEHGFQYWTAVATAIRAWTRIERGDVATGVADLEELVRRDREAGVYPLVWIIARVDLVDGLMRLHRYDDALAIVDEAKRNAPQRLLNYNMPEIHRLEAELWHARRDDTRARACFEQAIELAREHGARSLELRAVLGYCRIDPARRASLARLYATFTEGLGTADLVEARDLLAIAHTTSATCDLEGVKAHVLGRLARELAPELTYHCLEHTRDDVLPAALELAARHGVSEADTTLLATAVLFHDLGFVEQRDGHERVGVRIAREVLPGYGYSAEQIEIICGIIMATKLPQAPHTLLEQLMADADLDVLGRDDFIDKNDSLRQEWAGFGEATTREQWYTSQLAFVRNHTYFTTIANEWRGEGKQRNIAELERRLLQAKAGTT